MNGGPGRITSTALLPEERTATTLAL